MCSLILARLWELWQLFKNLDTLPAPPPLSPQQSIQFALLIVKKEEREEEAEGGKEEEEAVRGWRSLGLTEENGGTVETVHNAHFIRWHSLGWLHVGKSLTAWGSPYRRKKEQSNPWEKRGSHGTQQYRGESLGQRAQKGRAA